MEIITAILTEFAPYITLALIIINLIMFIIIIICLNSNSRLEKRYRKLMRGVEGNNLEKLVVSYFDKIDEVKESNENIKENIQTVQKQLDTCVQKVSVVRYRAYEDVGSDLSFSIAMLDEENSGLILTGIYGRNESTTYAKPIDNGISRYSLSEEEKQALNQAMNNSKLNEK